MSDPLFDSVDALLAAVAAALKVRPASATA